MSATTSGRLVGVDLQAVNEDTNRLVQAIEKDNPDAAITHLPGLVKISVPGALTIRRDSVESLLGRPWETHEFQLAIVSYFGHIKEWDDEGIVISWDH